MNTTDPQPVELSPLRSRALGDEVYDVLLDLLTTGGFEAGAPLGIDYLSRRFGISPTPIREALARLEHTGLVRREANRGYRVSPPLSVDQMRQLMDARIVLEVGTLGHAMTNAAALATDLDRALTAQAKATKALEAPGALSDHAKVQTYYMCDWAFHQAILDHSHNVYLDRAVNGLAFSVHRMRQTNAILTTDAPMAIVEHTAVLEAVRSGDSDAAKAAFTQHLENVKTRAREEVGNGYGPPEATA